MAEALAPKTANVRDLLIRKTLTGDTTLAALIFLIILGFAFVGISKLNPPEAVPATAPAAEFSSGRAMEHLRVIAQAPHPVGSIAHDEVRDFILGRLTALELRPAVQATSVLEEGRGNLCTAATVENIIARVAGTGGAKALLLVSHYDSVPNGAGASDNGAAVAAMLETARALKAAPPLKNDIVFLFTDAEEVGLLGAKAFANEHPLAKNIGLVINFEARGTGGPSVMFETSSQNGWLIDEFARSAPHPVASSLSYELYRLLPNDTDLSVFKRAGYSALNLAYIDGASHYHTQLDSIEQIDERSLQHHGSYALALAQHFGNLDLENIRSQDSIYFDLFGASVIRYPVKWVTPLAAIAILSFLAVAVFGYRKRLLTVRGVAFGFAALSLSMFISGALVTLGWFIIRSFNPEYLTLPQGEIYDSKLYVIAFVGLTIATTTTLYIWFRTRSSIENLMAGALLWFVILTACTAVVLQGASYLFTWPLLFNTVALGFMLTSEKTDSRSAKTLLALSLCPIPCIILFAPMIHLVFTAMTVSMSGGVALILVLPLGILIPQLALVARPAKWALPVAAALVAVICITIAGTTSGYTAHHPKPNSLFYVMSADSGKATWASFDQTPDPWTSQFLSRPRRGPLSEYFPTGYQGFLQSEAAPVSAQPPEVLALADTRGDGSRTLRLRVASVRQAPLVSVFVFSDTEFQGAAVGDKRISRKLGNRWGLTYHALPKEGVEITLETPSSEPVKVIVMDMTYGLPELPGQSFKPRPANMMSTRPYGDSTIVSKSFSF